MATMKRYSLHVTACVTTKASAWVQILALQLTSCVTMGKLLNLSGPQLPHKVAVSNKCVTVCEMPRTTYGIQ